MIVPIEKSFGELNRTIGPIALSENLIKKRNMGLLVLFVVYFRDTGKFVS